MGSYSVWFIYLHIIKIANLPLKEDANIVRNHPEENSDSSRSPGTDRDFGSSDTSEKSDDNSRSPGTDRDLSSSDTSKKSSDTSDNSNDDSRSPGTDRRE